MMSFWQKRFLISIFLILALTFQPIIISSVYAQSGSKAQQLKKAGELAKDVWEKGKDVLKITPDPAKEAAKAMAAKGIEDSAKSGMLNRAIQKFVGMITDAKLNVKLMIDVIDSIISIVKLVRNPARSILDSATTLTGITTKFHKEETILDVLIGKMDTMVTSSSIVGMILAGAGALAASTGIFVHIGATCSAIGTAILGYAKTAGILLSALKAGIVVGKAATKLWYAASNKLRSWWEKRKAARETGIQPGEEPPDMKEDIKAIDETNDSMSTDLNGPDDSDTVADPSYSAED
ncbi:MAG: hypothetical protein GQF41_0808 [Candidatus Rifleibacterium amylolyticum]|nr:MAG: hypothetical protein GQF41_0808 [Candidatus Rifleibacterium amylolyticum]NLF97904.1 hypothetical protein [Candidatus Riflebacteria bacterium]